MGTRNPVQERQSGALVDLVLQDPGFEAQRKDTRHPLAIAASRNQEAQPTRPCQWWLWG
jgi:hypothetical protein